ncbi:unnamed protein product [Rotaria socialis]|uniref:Reverse transcriptase domain-containing protein n=1 Tax=Rotaria socialis TaxID=392032 RepID=A0A818DDI4_9BILA|nr:unnamed protein product [Rotaria socialis]
MLKIKCGGDRNDGNDHKICLIKCQHCGNNEHRSNDYQCPSLLDFRRQIVSELRRRPDCLPPQVQFFIPVDCYPKGNYTRKLINPTTEHRQQWMERNGWERIFPTVPTSKRSSAIIDFALTHDKSYLTVEVIDEGTPDHFPILFSSPFTAAEDGFFRKTNWKLFTFFLSLVNEYWNACVYNFDEQFFFTLFSSFLASLWDRTSEYITIRKYRPPWPAYLISLARNVNKRRRMYRRTRFMCHLNDGMYPSEDKLRPISLLPNLGKWFERCIHEQIQAWCKDKGIYTDEQSGFTPNRHLQSRILSICEDLRLTVAANNRPALLIFVDFLSAFDNMWFPALIANLVELDMPLPLIKWIYQWLQERTMSIHHGYSQSKIVKLHVGAPQGSVLATTLFRIHIHFLPKYFFRFCMHLFADDVAILLKGSLEKKLSQNIIELEKQAKIAMHTLLSFSENHLLPVNVKKTKAMLVTYIVQYLQVNRKYFSKINGLSLYKILNT